jgi:hypothetical protein
MSHGEWKLASCARMVCAPGRGPNDHVMPTREAWLHAMRDAHTAGNTPGTSVSCVLIDPFSRTVTQLEAPLDHVCMRSKPISLLVVSASQAFLEGAIGAGEAGSVVKPLVERREDGAYVVTIAKSVSQEGVVPKDCGFQIFGEPFFGVVALSKGVQLYCPRTFSCVERGVDLLASELPEPEWLTPREVRSRRQAKQDRELLAAQRFRESTPAGTLFLGGPPATAYDCKRGTCKLCRKSADLRKCSRCGAAYYCGTECQKEDWPAHKLVCVAVTDRS